MKCLRHLIVWMLLIGCAIGANGQSPTVIDAKSLPKLIQALPDYAGFGYEGAGYFGGDLYVSCNLGLLVVKARKPAALYQWVKEDGVVDGPWMDVAGKTLWIQQAANNILTRFDGVHWQSGELPEPKDGYTRGDMLGGFRGVSGTTAFWLVGGGVAWRRDASANRWIQEPLPPMKEGSQLKAFVRLGATNVALAREGYAKTIEGLGDSAALYSIQGFVGTWKKKVVGDINPREVLVIGQVSYVRTEDGALYSLTADALTRMDVPAPCEAITQTSDGLLLGFFGKAGVCARLGDRWELRVESPFSDNEEAHRTSLAENAGEVALVTALGVSYNASTNKAGHTGQAGIWLSQGSKFERGDTPVARK